MRGCSYLETLRSAQGRREACHEPSRRASTLSHTRETLVTDVPRRARGGERVTLTPSAARGKDRGRGHGNRTAASSSSRVNGFARNASAFASAARSPDLGETSPVVI